MKNKIPEGWKEVELGEVLDFQKKSKIKAGEGNEKGKYKFFTSSDVQSKFIDKASFEGEYLIFSTGGSAGVHYCNEKFSSSTDCFVVKVDSKLISKYVYYYLSTNIYILEAGFKGAGLKHISKEYLKKVKIIYPENKEVQKKIVSILENAEKAKDMRKDADDLTKDFLKSVFIEMFGGKKNFEKTKIGEVIIETENENPEREYPDKFFEYVDISSIDNKQGKIISSTKVLGKEAPSRAKQKIKFNDLLISTVRPNLNSVALVPKELDQQICSTGFCILRADNKKVLPEYLYQISRNNQFIESMNKIAKGASYPAVSDKDILSYEIPLPPFPLQQKFASIVNEVEQMKEQQKHSKGQLDNLFNALMQKAFKGGIL